MTKKISLIIFLTLFFLSAGNALAYGTATVSWNKPVNTDGSAIGDLYGYRVCYSTDSTKWDDCSLNAIQSVAALSGATCVDVIGADTLSYKFDNNLTVASTSEGTRFYFTVFARDITGNFSGCAKMGTSPTGATQVSKMVVNNDSTAPGFVSSSPSGTLAIGTTSTTLSITTNENATCRYAKSAGTAFGSMTNNFTGSGTSHTTTASGLVSGTNSFYVRCQDTVGNTNSSDYIIGFNVASDTTPPSISSNYPKALSAGTTSETLSVTTNESATCKYGTSDVVFASLPSTFTTTGGTSHSQALSGLTNGTTYRYFVRCRDGNGNINTSSHGITFSVASPSDTTAPVISGNYPKTLSAGTTTETLNVTTNGIATCKYGTSDVVFASLPNTLATIGGTSHSKLIDNLTNGSSYKYFVRCRDGNSNVNSTGFEVNFSVASSPSTPPTTTVDSGSSDSKSGSSSSKKKKKKKKKKKAAGRYSISVSKKVVRNGQVIIERGKKFSKNSFVLLYFSKYGNVYYPPRKIKTSTTGAFAVSYLVRNKLRGTYSWYAVDIKTGKRSKTSYYTVK